MFDTFADEPGLNTSDQHRGLHGGLGKPEAECSCLAGAFENLARSIGKFR